MGIKDVYNLGLDALSNLFYVSLEDNDDGVIADLKTELEISDYSVADGVKFRVQDFEIPSIGVNVYEVNWGSQSFERPGGKVEMPKEFTLNVRLDREYALYKFFRKWKNKIANDYSGIIGSNSNYTAKIVVYPADSNNESTNDDGWSFEKVWPKNIGSISYDYGNGDPIILSVTMGMLRMSALEPANDAGDSGTDSEAENGEQ